MSVENISTKMVKARKEYRCEYSGKKIKVGDIYSCQVNVFDGEIYTFRICEEADYIAKELDMYGKGTDNEGFGEDDYEELLWDYVNKHKLNDEYENYKYSLHDFVYEHLKRSDEK